MLFYGVLGQFAARLALYWRIVQVTAGYERFRQNSSDLLRPALSL